MSENEECECLHSVEAERDTLLKRVADLEEKLRQATHTGQCLEAARMELLEEYNKLAEKNKSKTFNVGLGQGIPSQQQRGRSKDGYLV